MILYDFRDLTATTAPTGRPRLPEEHGTERGYQQHRIRRTPACQTCKAAHSRHNQRLITVGDHLAHAAGQPLEPTVECAKKLIDGLRGQAQEGR